MRPSRVGGEDGETEELFRKFHAGHLEQVDCTEVPEFGRTGTPLKDQH